MKKQNFYKHIMLMSIFMSKNNFLKLHGVIERLFEWVSMVKQTCSLEWSYLLI